MNRLIITALTLLVSFTWTFADTWDGVSADKSWYDSNQVEYHLYNAAQLKGLADLVNNEKVTFRECTFYLESDIDLNNQQWIPIGFGNTAFDGGQFDGVFDGQEYTINNMFIDTSQLPYSQGVLTIGLFGNLGGMLTNLTLHSTIELRSSENIYSSFVFYVGGLAGKGNSISHCICKTDFYFYMSGNNFTYVGFAAGEATNVECVKTDGVTHYYNCYMSGTLGGIVGNGNIIKQCASIGSLIVPSYPQTNGSHIGGIAGQASLIEDVIFTGVMRTYDHSYSKKETFVGGIAGGGYEGTIKNAIFAPSEYDTNVSMYFIGQIAPTYSTFSVSNAFYISDYASSFETYGIATSREILTSGVKLNGFDDTLWKFAKGEFPQLISLIPISKYTLSYIVDGEIYKEYKIKEGYPITPEPEPTKEGYIFSGWSEIPETMPAHDVTVTGTFTKDIMKCATPTISYANGEVTFNSETEGVTFIFDTNIEDKDIKGGIGNKLQFSVTYHISVYAQKEDYYDSDVATATLCWIDVEPATEGIIDEDVVNEVKAMPVLIQTQGGIVSIQGAAEGTPIAIYGVDGKMYGSAISEKDRTTISTSLQPGTVAVVKIGEKAVKVLVK